MGSSEFVDDRDVVRRRPTIQFGDRKLWESHGNEEDEKLLRILVRLFKSGGSLEGHGD